MPHASTTNAHTVDTIAHTAHTYADTATDAGVADRAGFGLRVT